MSSISEVKLKHYTHVDNSFAAYLRVQTNVAQYEFERRGWRFPTDREPSNNCTILSLLSVYALVFSGKERATPVSSDP